MNLKLLTILSCLAALAYIGCNRLDESNYDKDFLSMYQQASQIYHLDDVELAKRVMLDLEQSLIEMENETRLYGAKTSLDYLYATRLRLWGIAVFLGDAEMKLSYETALQNMKMKDREPLVSDKDFKKSLSRVDGEWKPKWTGLAEKDPFPKEMTTQEMIDAGYIRRVE